MKCYLKDHGVSDTLNNLHWCARHTKQSTHFYFGVSDTLHIFSVIAHHRLMTNKCAVHTSLFTIGISESEFIQCNLAHKFLQFCKAKHNFDKGYILMWII